MISKVAKHHYYRITIPISWFIVGAAPALLVLLVRMVVKEPESWTLVRERRREANAWATAQVQMNSTSLRSNSCSARHFAVTL